MLTQLQVVGVSEGPDPRVGGHDPASQVAAEGALLQMREWLLEQRRPHLLVADRTAAALDHFGALTAGVAGRIFATLTEPLRSQRRSAGGC